MTATQQQAALTVTERTTCRVCGSADLVPLFSLGTQYISNFVTAEELANPVGPKFIEAPLELILCRECTLVQLRHTAPQELLYSRHYWYRSGVTQTMRDALRDVTAAIESRVKLSGVSVVLDIGSNDGTLLRSYETHPSRVGFEPATNLVSEGSLGCKLINDFWSADTYFENIADEAKVITALGMFYDLEDPNAFIRDVAKVLRSDGVFVAQLMCLRNMLNIGDVGNICHEHLEYYSLRSLHTLLGNHGLEIYDLETNSVNGESYRLWIRHKGYGMHGPRPSEGAGTRIRAAESAEAGLDNPDFYRVIFSNMELNKRRIRDFIINANERCKRVWVYGASTKGNTLLQYWGLDNTLIQGAADRSPEKWGKYTIGTNIPIYSEDEARVAKPDYFLVLPYAFLSEFVAREAEQEWRISGGKFLVPLPHFREV